MVFAKFAQRVTAHHLCRRHDLWKPACCGAVGFWHSRIAIRRNRVIAFSILIAAATSWALTREPLVLSPRSRARISSITSKKFGRYLVPHPDRVTTTAVGAAVFGSVAPIIVASLEEGRPTGKVGKLTGISGISYGLAFASGYGIIGAIAGAAV